MSNAKTILLVVMVMALAGYAVHMNMTLNKTVSQYEMSAAEMADRFEKVNEDTLKAREELARQMSVSEKALAAVEAVKAEVAKVISEVKKADSTPVTEVPVEPVIATKKDEVLSGARAKAEKAKAKAEALLNQISDKPNVWEERSAHL
ncbi:MAG: hypothetical protein KKE81_01575 [Candidatus Omnitrophica bacterium]|nr:hypothetical protein [Candidatus Omnitrophota bacterium]